MVLSIRGSAGQRVSPIHPAPRRPSVRVGPSIAPSHGQSQHKKEQGSQASERLSDRYTYSTAPRSHRGIRLPRTSPAVRRILAHSPSDTFAVVHRRIGGGECREVGSERVGGGLLFRERGEELAAVVLRMDGVRWVCPYSTSTWRVASDRVGGDACRSRWDGWGGTARGVMADMAGRFGVGSQVTSQR